MRKLFGLVAEFKCDNLYKYLPAAVLIDFIYFFIINQFGIRPASNIVLYILGCILFFAVFVIQVVVINSGKAGILKWEKFIVQKQRTKSERILIIALSIFCLVYLYISVNYSESKLFTFQQLFTFLLTLSLAYLVYVNKNKASTNCYFRLLVGITLILYTGYCLFMPNYFEDQSGGIHHVDAYTTSIINVCNDYPYQLENASIYGHHGIILRPVVKLLNNFVSQWTAITLTLAICGALAVGLMILLIDRLADNDIIFLLASLSICYYSCYSRLNGNYYQMEPHRYLFQAIILTGCYLCIKNPQRKWLRVIMWCFSSLAVLWNLETGLVCLVVWTLLSISLSNREKWHIGSILLHIVWPVISFAGAYGLTCLYNLSVGGEGIDILTFIYPLGEGLRPSETYKNSTFIIENLGFGTRSSIDLWFIMFVVLISYFTLCVPKILFHQSEDLDLMGLTASTIGLGTFIYYMNEPWMECKYITIYGLVLVSIIILNKRRISSENISDNTSKEDCNTKSSQYCKKGNIYNILPELVVVFLLSFWGYSSMAAIPQRVMKLEARTHNEEGFDTYIDAVSAKIPENTVFIGKGAPQLCSALNRKNTIALMDEPDITEIGKNYAKNLIEKNKYEYILMDENSRLQFLVEGHKYEAVDDFTYYDVDGEIVKTYVLYQYSE